MASTSLRLLDTISLAASQTRPRDQVADLGAYRQLALCMRLLKPGTGTGGGRVKLQHAAVNEEGAFFDVTGATWVVDSTDQSYYRESTACGAGDGPQGKVIHSCDLQAVGSVGEDADFCSTGCLNGWVLDVLETSGAIDLICAEGA